MRIIIAIDLIDGKCVRLTRGDYGTKKIYNENPLEIAKQIEGSGLEHLHLVDLDGARLKKVVNYKVLELISTKTSLSIDFGGGIRTDEDIRIAFDSGAKQVTGGSIAISSPVLFCEWLEKYGNDKIILGADCIDRKIATDGWTEKSEEDVIKFISDYCSKGVKYTICTDVSKDGMMMGPSAELYKEILDNMSVSLIASGGITSMKDVELLIKTGCEGAIIGKAVYEGKITFKDLKKLC